MSLVSQVSKSVTRIIILSYKPLGCLSNSLRALATAAIMSGNKREY